MFIDEVRMFLEFGEILLIFKQENGFGGTLLKYDSSFSVSRVNEVEVKSWIERFPKIIEEVEKYNRRLVVYYDGIQNQVISRVEQKVFEGAYNEEESYKEVVGVTGDDVFTNFFSLEDKIKAMKDTKEGIVKKKEFEEAHI